MSETAKKTGSFSLSIIAIFILFMASGAGSFENSAVQAIIEAWPNVAASTVRQFVTISSLVCIPVSLFVSPFIGTKIKYKPAMLAGLILVSVGGLLPFFFAPNWTFVLFCRCLLGVGVGLLGPRNALVTGTVEESKQAAYLGYANTFYFAWSIVAGPLAGWLVGFGWNFSVWVNFVAVVAAVLVLLFMKEPEVKAAENTEAKSNEKISPWSWVFAAMQAIMTGTVYPLLMGMGTIFATHNIGNAALAGTYISAYSIGATVGGIVLGTFTKIFKGNTFTVSMIIEALAMLLMAFFPSAVPMLVGTFISGVAFAMSLAGLQVNNAEITPASRMAFTSTLIVAANMLGVYISNYFINISHAIFHRACDIDSAILGCAAVWIIMAVFMFVGKSSLNKAKENLKK